MLCHLALAISLFNLGFILFILRRMERRRAATNATDKVLESIRRNPRNRTPTVRAE